MRTFTRNVCSASLIVATVGTVFAADNPPPPVPPASPAIRPVTASAAPGGTPAALVPAAGAPAAAEAATAGPKIEFATPVYDFGRVKAGDLVKYSYVFTNGGDSVLQLASVQPSCGCTTAGDWTREVKPGETGKVAIQFNSANFNGQVFKTITVTCNDKQKPVTVLQLKGTIWKPIELVPAYTILNIPPDAPGASASIRIINNTDDPLTLSEPESNNKSFKPALSTTKAGKEYQLTISSGESINTGNLQGKVLFKTSWTNVPTLEVPFWVNVQPAIMVIPPHVMVPRGSMAGKTPTTVTIQNNSTNAVTLSDAAVNVPEVGVELKEIQPGKVYHALLTFPEGFEIPAGKQVALTVKSTSPRMPEIRVPISQSPVPYTPPGAVSKPQPPAPAPASAIKPAEHAQAKQ